MAYIPSARKYRPRRFADVFGQEAIISTLQNGIRMGKMAHAYLFSGSRGVGKTTIARILARAINCPQKVNGVEPCNECASCLEMLSGQSLDLIEIDGASNRGIDDVRSLAETIVYVPSKGPYKIVLIDEVHMLTKEAFNALLKTIEEPPLHAKFFFATTELSKVPSTIVSRCQRFTLKRLQDREIAAKLSKVASDLQLSFENEALLLIASFAEGSLRDAESLLDQVSAFGEGVLTEAIVRQALQLLDQSSFARIDSAFFEGNLPFAFEWPRSLFEQGADFGHVLDQLISRFRALAIGKTQGKEGIAYTAPQLYHILECLLAARAKNAFDLVHFEALLIQIIRSKSRIPHEILVRRLVELEGKIGVTKESSALYVKQEKEELPLPPVEDKKPFLKKEVFEAAKAPPAAEGVKTTTILRFAAVELEASIKP